MEKIKVKQINWCWFCSLCTYTNTYRLYFHSLHRYNHLCCGSIGSSQGLNTGLTRILLKLKTRPLREQQLVHTRQCCVFFDWKDFAVNSTLFFLPFSFHALIHWIEMVKKQTETAQYTGENPAAMQHASSNRSSPIDWVHLFTLIAAIFCFLRWL